MSSEHIKKNRIIHDGLIFNKYLNQTEISSRILKLSKNLNTYYKNKNPLIVGVLNGCIFFMMDLLKNLNFDYTIDFIRAESYIGKERNKLNLEITNKNFYFNKNILLIEDIIDSGNTVDNILKTMASYNPKEVKVITLLNKNKNINSRSFKIDWHGFNIDQKYVIGYGMDYNNLFRYLKDIYIENEK